MILLSVATTSKSLRAHHEGTQGKEDEHDTTNLEKIFFVVVETNINFRNFWETVIEYKVILEGTHLCFYRPLNSDLYTCPHISKGKRSYRAIFSTGPPLKMSID